MKVSEVDIDISLLQRDKIKQRKINRENDHAHMAKRKDKENAKIRTELDKMFNYITNNMEYGSQIGYKEDDGKPDEKKEGDEKKKRKKNVVKWRKYRAYDCIIVDNENKKAQLTEDSQYCKFNGNSKDFIASSREKYLSSIIISETGNLGKLMINWCRKYGTSVLK